MNETGPSRIISIAEYEKTVESTDTLIPDSQIESILLGLFGEVGSVMSTAKKLHREKGAFEAGYGEDTEEEFGDVLWYVTALCRRCRIGIADLISEVLAEGDYTVSLAANSGPRCLSRGLSACRSRVGLIPFCLRWEIVRVPRLGLSRTQARPARC
ncbi:MAG: hypothetical protein OXE81_06605 [Gammaproteobacteria bacterium]|nr:hypothetical protein [Gammaproteobacteria bacterium]